MIEYQVKVFEDGTEWILNGKRHREDGPAREYTNGTKFWYRDGKCHREDGPAMEYADGSKYWYLNGKLHREDGPAVEWSDGGKYWYLNGKEVTEADVMGHTIIVDGKECKISKESYENLKGAIK